MNLKSLFSASTPKGRATRLGTEKSVTAVAIGGVLGVVAAERKDGLDVYVNATRHFPLDAAAGAAALAGSVALKAHPYAQHLANAGTCMLAVSTFRMTGVRKDGTSA